MIWKKRPPPVFWFYTATLILGGYDPLEACRAALVEPLNRRQRGHLGIDGDCRR